MDHHRVNGVPRQSHTARNFLMCHRIIPLYFLNACKGLFDKTRWPFAAASLALVGCEGPQSILDPAGPSALIISRLWWGMFSFFTLVLIVVCALWIYAMRRQSSPKGEEHARRVHNRWIIGGGILLPLISVVVILFFGIPVGQEVRAEPENGPPGIRVEVVGHRWWWEIRYPDAGVVTANEFYLPAGEPVDVYVTTADVIHSFWVPRLSGKIDLVPGRTHHIRLQAESAGPMRGQCAEFCGQGHAHMVLDVQAVAATEFDAWLQARQQPVAVPERHEEAVQAFRDHCGECHRIAGVSQGSGGPDLSNVGARRLLGIRNSDAPRTIEQWLSSHPTFLEGGSSPNHRLLAADDHKKIAAWLETLGND